MRALAITPRPSSLRCDAVKSPSETRPVKTSTKSKPSPAARVWHDRRAQLRRFTSHGGRLSSATALTLTAWVRDVSPRILGTSSFATEMVGMPRHVRDERLEAREILRPVTILPPSRASSVTST